MGYLYRPVAAGFCSMEALHRTELDLADFADANEYLDAVAENDARMGRWMAAQQGRR